MGIEAVHNQGSKLKSISLSVSSIVLVACSYPLFADSYTRVVALQKENVVASQVIQNDIEKVADELTDMRSEYRNVNRHLSSIAGYNDHMNNMITSQVNEMASLTKQLEQIEETNREVIPLITRMLSTLEEFVSLDVPFLPDERKERIQNLQEMMVRADVSISEKFRRLLEAYQVEIEYGNNLETYHGKMEMSGSMVNVEFLRIGRVALIYQSIDRRVTGFWNSQNNSWQVLDGSYRKPVTQALRVAKRQAAPELIRVPVIISEGAVK